MLRAGSVSPFNLKRNVKKGEHRCGYEVERRSFRKVLVTPNSKIEKRFFPPVDSECINSILKPQKDDNFEFKKEKFVEKKLGFLVKNSFEPEIYLSNKIIQDLTSKYKAELLPLNLQRSKGNRKGSKETLKDANEALSQNWADFKSESTNLNMEEVKKKAVTFLDDKLKRGFTNAGFVLSPSSINETIENSSFDGIINDGFVSSPTFAVEEKNSVRKPFDRPKPIISPSEEFLESLNERHFPEKGSEEDLNGIHNEGFIQSPDSSAIEIEEKLLEKERAKGKKKRGFVNQMRKISNRKCFFNEKENLPKHNKRRYGILNNGKKKKESKFGEKIAPETEIFERFTTQSWEDETVTEVPDAKNLSRLRSESLRSSTGSVETDSNSESSLKKHSEWKFSSMSSRFLILLAFVKGNFSVV